VLAGRVHRHGISQITPHHLNSGSGKLRIRATAEDPHPAAGRQQLLDDKSSEKAPTAGHQAQFAHDPVALSGTPTRTGLGSKVVQ
jgi:hypothetical protein